MVCWIDVKTVEKSEQRRDSEVKGFGPSGDRRLSTGKKIPQEKMINNQGKRRLSQLYDIYGEQHTTTRRNSGPVDLSKFKHRPHFPDLFKPVVSVDSLLKSSNENSREQENKAKSQTKGLTLPNINQVKQS